MSWARKAVGMTAVDHRTVVGHLARALAQQDRPRSFPERLAHAYRAMLGGNGAAITLGGAPGQVLVACAGDASARVEQLHVASGQGPGLWAYRTGRQIQVAIGGANAVDARWARWDAAARQAFPPLWLDAAPIHVGGQVAGVLTTLRFTADAGPLTGDGAQFLADVAGVVLSPEPKPDGSRRPDGSARTDLALHYATGVVVAQLGIGPDEAVGLMRAYAFAISCGLHQVATEVNTGRLDLSAPGSAVDPAVTGP